jgi:hypothetical protein
MNPPAPGFVDFFAGSGMEFEKKLGIRGFEIGKSVPVYGGVIFTAGTDPPAFPMSIS